MLGFCLSFFFFQHLLSFLALFSGLVALHSLSFFYFFFKLLFNFFIFNKFLIYYFNNFILFYFTFCFLSFFLFSPFSSEPCGWEGLGAKPVPLRWESQVQDLGPPETYGLHVISNGESSPRNLHINTKIQLHSTTSKLQCWTPYVKQLARQEHNPTH